MHLALLMLVRWGEWMTPLAQNRAAPMFTRDDKMRWLESGLPLAHCILHTYGLAQTIRGTFEGRYSSEPLTIARLLSQKGYEQLLSVDGDVLLVLLSHEYAQACGIELNEIFRRTQTLVLGSPPSWSSFTQRKWVPTSEYPATNKQEREREAAVEAYRRAENTFRSVVVIYNDIAYATKRHIPPAPGEILKIGCALHKFGSAVLGHHAYAPGATIFYFSTGDPPARILGRGQLVTTERTYRVLPGPSEIESADVIARDREQGIGQPSGQTSSRSSSRAGSSTTSDMVITTATGSDMNISVSRGSSDMDMSDDTDAGQALVGQDLLKYQRRLVVKDSQYEFFHTQAEQSRWLGDSLDIKNLRRVRFASLNMKGAQNVRDAKSAGEVIGSIMKEHAVDVFTLSEAALAVVDIPRLKEGLLQFGYKAEAHVIGSRGSGVAIGYRHYYDAPKVPENGRDTEGRGLFAILSIEGEPLGVLALYPRSGGHAAWRPCAAVYFFSGSRNRAWEQYNSI